MKAYGLAAVLAAAAILAGLIFLGHGDGARIDIADCMRDASEFAADEPITLGCQSF